MFTELFLNRYSVWVCKLPLLNMGYLFKSDLIMPKRTQKYLYQKAVKHQERIHKTHPHINIELLGCIGTKYKIYYECTKHNHRGYRSLATILKSNGCPECSREGHLRNNEDYKEENRIKEYKIFLEKAFKLHQDKYEYFDDYVCSRTKINILCKKHNEVFSQLPSAHIQGQGCPLCGAENAIINSRCSEEEFEKHWLQNNTNSHLSYVKGSFIQYHAPVTVHCNIHGNITKSAIQIARSPNACTKCSKEAQRKQYEKDFIEKSKSLYPDHFEYHDAYYVNNRTRVTLHCKLHGECKVLPLGHLSTTDSHQSGCKECAKLSFGRWSPKVLEKNIEVFKKEVCFLYLLKMDDFYKIGITKYLNNRFKMIEDESGITPQLVSLYKTNTYNACCLEHELMDKFKTVRFSHEAKFGGYTECYNFNQEQLEEVINFFNQADSS